MHFVQALLELRREWLRRAGTFRTSPCALCALGPLVFGGPLQSKRLLSGGEKCSPGDARSFFFLGRCVNATSQLFLVLTPVVTGAQNLKRVLFKGDGVEAGRL